MPRNFFPSYAVIIAALTLLPAAYAQESTDSLGSTDSVGSTNNLGWWQQTKNRLGNITDNGAEEVYLSGYAYHGRDTYTAEQIRDFNEKAWGLGGGRTLRNDSGNDESLYFFTIRDSHSNPQIMAGYAYEWVWNIPKTEVEVSAGYTAMLMSRRDYFGGFPFPIALPVASIGINGAKFMASYVPRLSPNKGNGDVLLLFARFEVK